MSNEIKLSSLSEYMVWVKDTSKEKQGNLNLYRGHADKNGNSSQVYTEQIAKGKVIGLMNMIYISRCYVVVPMLSKRINQFLNG